MAPVFGGVFDNKLESWLHQYLEDVFVTVSIFAAAFIPTIRATIILLSYYNDRSVYTHMHLNVPYLLDNKLANESKTLHAYNSY